MGEVGARSTSNPLLAPFANPLGIGDGSSRRLLERRASPLFWSAAPILGSVNPALSY
jgi:hypothetical protein